MTRVITCTEFKTKLVERDALLRENNKGTCKFRRLQVILFVLFFCRYLG